MHASVHYRSMQQCMLLCIAGGVLLLLKPVSLRGVISVLRWYSEPLVPGASRTFSRVYCGAVFLRNKASLKDFLKEYPYSLKVGKSKAKQCKVMDFLKECELSC